MVKERRGSVLDRFSSFFFGMEKGAPCWPFSQVSSEYIGAVLMILVVLALEWFKKGPLNITVRKRNRQALDGYPR